jgi:hypothetical protein
MRLSTPALLAVIGLIAAPSRALRFCAIRKSITNPAMMSFLFA